MSGLTLDQQRAVMRTLTRSQKQAVRAYCRKHQMSGGGLMSILKSIGSVLGPIAKVVGPTVMKEFLLPYLKKRVSGGALKLAGQGITGKSRTLNITRKKRAP